MPNDDTKHMEKEGAALLIPILLGLAALAGGGAGLYYYAKSKGIEQQRELQLQDAVNNAVLSNTLLGSVLGSGIGYLGGFLEPDEEKRRKSQAARLAIGGLLGGLAGYGLHKLNYF